MNTRSFFQEYGFTIIFVVVFLLAFIWMGTKRTLQSNANNVADWLPDSFAETQEYKWFIKHFPYESFIVASWRGCTLDDPRLEMLAQKLVPGQTIDNMEEWADKDVSLAAELKFAEEKIALPPPEQRITQESAAEIQEQEKEDQEVDDGLHYFKTVITGPRLVRMMQDRYPSLKLEQIVDRLDGVLIGPQYDYKPGMDEDCKHRNSALIVTLAGHAKGKELRKVVAKIKELARECDIEPLIPEDNRSIAQKVVDSVKEMGREMLYGRNPSTDGVILGGPPIDNVAIDYEGERTLFRLAGLCALIGLIVAYLCLKSLLMALTVFWIGVLAAGISLAFVSFTGEHCDAILLSMPALVYVLTMAGAVHMVNYYLDAIREHGIVGAPERMLSHAWYPCVISSTTTALGLASLYTSHLIPIIKFGVYSAIAVMAALGLLFLYLPSILYFCPPKKYVEQFSNKGLSGVQDHIFLRFWRMFGGFIIRNHNGVAIFCVTAMVFLGLGLNQIKTSVKMMRFFSPDSEIIAHYTWLEEQLGPLVPMEVVLKFDNSQCDMNSFERIQFVEQVCKAIRRDLPEQIGGVMSAATFAPDLNVDTSKRSVRINATAYAASKKIDDGRATSKDYINVEKISFDRTQYAPEDEPLFQQRLDQMGITPAQATQLVAAGLPTIDLLLYNSENVNVPGLSVQELDQLRQKAQVWQNKFGTDLWRVSMRVWALKKADIDYAVFINDVKEVVDPMMREKVTDRKVHSEDAISAIYTGMVPVVYKTQHELLNGLSESFFWSFVSIAFVLMFVLRSFTAGFLAMMPNLFPIMIVFGFIGRAGILVDVGMMMSASVALGIAVDDTIHYLTWFREAIDRGMTARDAAMDAYEKCATAMTETTVIAGCGLSAFMFSTFTPTQMFGTMMLVILFAALFGDLIFLPSILTGPAGRFFYKKKKKVVQEEPKSETLEPTPTPALTVPNSTIDLQVDDRYVGRCHIVDNMLDNENNKIGE